MLVLAEQRCGLSNRGGGWVQLCMRVSLWYKQIQCFVSPCCKVHMLVELWQNCILVSVVEVAGYDEKGVRVIGLSSQVKSPLFI